MNKPAHDSPIRKPNRRSPNSPLHGSTGQWPPAQSGHQAPPHVRTSPPAQSLRSPIPSTASRRREAERPSGWQRRPGGLRRRGRAADGGEQRPTAGRRRLRERWGRAGAVARPHAWQQ
ncbi:hypothetical protein PVAP13_9KG279626 [Panicum virgatum]|uniref:Uncharacterized protein n=1 Tax=Panicum virgatum TaxID=38727 RepID=A0A8T0NRR2_PANVG|nr:hypothetical protein PVAP13_9KG279626 [Panicum virgatum]